MTETESDTDDARAQVLSTDGNAERCRRVAEYLIDVLVAEDRLPDRIDHDTIQGPYDVTPQLSEFQESPVADDLREHDELDDADVQTALDDLDEDDITATGFSVLTDGPEVAYAIAKIVHRERAALDDAAAALDVHPPVVSVSVSEQTPVPNVESLGLVSVSYPNLCAEFGVE